MLAWIIQISLISIIIIFLVHHLITFFKTTLTVPKIKDLVNSSNQKYQNMFDTILHKSDFSTSYTDIDLLPTIPNNLLNNNNNSNIVETNSMKNELKSFLKKQLNTDNNIVGIESVGNTFSNF